MRIHFQNSATAGVTRLKPFSNLSLLSSSAMEMVRANLRLVGRRGFTLIELLVVMGVSSQPTRNHSM
jgi:prepilin-type N-terminal cleavage/methylation domain-containing protein